MISAVAIRPASTLRSCRRSRRSGARRVVVNESIPQVWRMWRISTGKVHVPWGSDLQRWRSPSHRLWSAGDGARGTREVDLEALVISRLSANANRARFWPLRHRRSKSPSSQLGINSGSLPRDLDCSSGILTAPALRNSPDASLDRARHRLSTAATPPKLKVGWSMLAPLRQPRRSPNDLHPPRKSARHRDFASTQRCPRAPAGTLRTARRGSRRASRSKRR